MQKVLCTGKHVPMYRYINQNLKYKLYKLIMENQLSDIEGAIDDIKKGKLVIVVDDEDRENEGDFITAARNITPEIVNFMTQFGRGLLCAPIEEDRCHELG